MVDASEIDDLIQDILDVSEGLDDVNPMLTQLAIDIQDELRSGRFVDRTGELRRSMRAYVDGNTLKIAMLYYGYFLSFGTRDSFKSPLTEEVSSIFNKPEGSFFKQPDKNRGIAARSFYPTNIQELIADRLEALALQNLED